MTLEEEQKTASEVATKINALNKKGLPVFDMKTELCEMMGFNNYILKGATQIFEERGEQLNDKKAV